MPAPARTPRMAGMLAGSPYRGRAAAAWESPEFGRERVLTMADDGRVNLARIPGNDVSHPSTVVNHRPPRHVLSLAGESRCSYNLLATPGAFRGNAMVERLERFRAFGAAFGVGALASIALFQPAFAASHEQIHEMCKQLVHPQVHACVQGKKGNGDIDAIRKSCSEAFVRPCVLREEQKEAA